MKKFLLPLILVIIVPTFLRTEPVFAVATECQFLEIGSTYTMLNAESSCQFFGTTDGVETGSESVNTASIVIPNGKQILVQNPDSSPQTITVGELQIQDGGSIVIPEGSQIIIGAPLYMKDTDNDGYVGSPVPKVKRAPDDDYKIRRNAIAHQEIDCNDNDAGSNITCVDVTPAPTMTPFPTYIQPSPTPTPTPACKNAGETCTVNDDCCSPNNCTDFYHDSDSDTYGDAGDTTKRCGATYSGYVTNNTDCDDTTATRWQNLTCNYDNDHDGYGTSATALKCKGSACNSPDDNPTDKYNTNTSTDCYDSNANAYPGSTYCSATNRGDGSYDYDCSGTATACMTCAADGDRGLTWCELGGPDCEQQWAYNPNNVACGVQCRQLVQGLYKCSNGESTCNSGGGVWTKWFGIGSLTNMTCK